jgi:hypothetical protein
LPTGSAKKVVVHRFEREPLLGFLDSATDFSAEEFPFLNPDGTIQPLRLTQIKVACFVRDWSTTKPWTRNQYAVRPRQLGLWIRLQFKDGELLEATMPNNLAALDPYAFTIGVPDAAPGIQRIIVPRPALESFELLGVIGSPLKQKPKPVDRAQLKMFE